MALPGGADSRKSEGCHKMIREGWATLVTSCADVLDALGDTGQLLKAGITQDPSSHRQPEPSASIREHTLTDTQKQIFQALAEPSALDPLSARTKLAIHVIPSGPNNARTARVSDAREWGFQTTSPRQRSVVIDDG